MITLFQAAIRKAQTAEEQAYEERGVMRRIFFARRDRFANHARAILYANIRAAGYDPLTMPPLT